jgi:glycosyltransferase involved in cell wall biosynthesis
MVVEAFLGGVATHVGNLSSALVGAGHEVHLLYSDLRADSNARCQLASAARSGVKCWRLPVSHWPSFADLGSGTLLRRYVRRVGAFDVLHAHSTKAGFLLRLSALGAGSSVVYTPHALMTMDPLLSSYKRRVAGFMERALAYVTDAVVAVSEGEAEHAVAIGIPARRVYVVPNGVDFTPPPRVGIRESIRFRWGVPADEFCVGFIGRFAPQKRPAMAVDAFGLLLSRTRRATLIMAGRGPQTEQVRERIEQLGLGASVRMLGEAPVSDVLPGLDALMLTSAYEGFPYVLLEAMAYGVPVVSTAIGGTEMLVTDGKNGFIAESIQEFACSLTRLARTPDLRIRMQLECLHRVSQFSIERMTLKMLDVYRRTLVRSSS